MHSFRLRLVSLLLFFIFLLSLLVARFYVLQIEEGRKWRKIARRQHYFIIQEPALRGTFFTQSHLKKTEGSKKLVVEIEKYHLHVDSQSIPDQYKKPIEDALLGKLNLSSAEKKHFINQFYKKSRNRKLVAWLDKEQQEDILNWWRPYSRKFKIPSNAIFFVSDYQRSYPYGSMLGQLLHTIRGFRDGASNQAAPTGGLELFFDGYLKGRPGKRKLMRSPKNSFETGHVIQLPIRGADIYLTIDHGLQAIVEEELERGVKKNQAKSGRAVMMDPKTGEILAIAHYPFFHPAAYQEYINDKNLIGYTQLGAITDALEPGSVMKPFTLCAALMANEELKAKGEEILFDPQQKTFTSDGKFPGRTRPLVDTRLHYCLNMPMAIQKSANIYMARLVEKIVNRLGSQWYRDFLYKTLQFGKKTGIEFPAESAGVVPRIGKCFPNGRLEWSLSTPFSLAIGYNLQVNAIQLVRAYAALANGGYLVRPTLIKRIVGYSKKEESSILVDNTLSERLESFPKIFSPSLLDEVVKSMKFTTKSGGSAPKGDVYGYSEAGKTSTAKKVVNGVYVDDYRATFIGFAPVQNPALVLFVLLDEPKYGYLPGIGKRHHGGTCAAPIFSRITKRSLAYLGIAKDDPYGYPVGDPRADHSKADGVLEAKNLQQLYEKWNQR